MSYAKIAVVVETIPDDIQLEAVQFFVSKAFSTDISDGEFNFLLMSIEEKTGYSYDQQLELLETKDD